MADLSNIVRRAIKKSGRKAFINNEKVYVLFVPEKFDQQPSAELPGVVESKKVRAIVWGLNSDMTSGSTLNLDSESYKIMQWEKVFYKKKCVYISLVCILEGDRDGLF